MQWHCFKIFVILFTLIFSSGKDSFGQISHYRLQQADSLFEAKQYTQSLEHYQAILQQKQYSPSMFLKMAFIQEGLNHIGEALYYLNLYYLATHDNSTLDKMDELAAKFNLAGYEHTDADRALTVYHQYSPTISMGLAVVIFFLLSVAIFMKRRKLRPIVAVVFLAFFVVVLGIHINFGERDTSAIITNPHTYLMEGPSSGASVYSVLNAGHRVSVLGRNDVWLKIRWDNQVVFVKENNLLPVTL